MKKSPKRASFSLGYDSYFEDLALVWNSGSSFSLCHRLFGSILFHTKANGHDGRTFALDIGIAS